MRIQTRRGHIFHGFVTCSISGYHVWLQQSVGNPKLFLHAVKQRIHDVNVQVLNDTISNSTRASLFYRTISQFEFSLYLDGIQVKKYSTAMSRLRLSSHRLAVESGRWYKPLPISFNERKCTICNVLQDEFHFVIEYNLCKDLSNRLVESKPKIRDNLCV